MVKEGGINHGKDQDCGCTKGQEDKRRRNEEGFGWGNKKKGASKEAEIVKFQIDSCPGKEE